VASVSVAIMYRGQLVELGPTAEVFARPRHGYTAALIGAHPGKRRLRDRIGADGTTPSPAPPLDRPGCPFRHRCAFANETCMTETPPLVWVTPAQMARCHVLPQRPELVASFYRVGEGGLR
jgi:peptide/nickel transport system ATP-binding protein